MSRLNALMDANEPGQSFNTRDTQRRRSRPTPTEREENERRENIRDKPITDDPFEFEGRQETRDRYEDNDDDYLEDEYEDEFEEERPRNRRDDNDDDLSDVIDDLLGNDAPPSVDDMLDNLFPNDNSDDDDNSPLARLLDRLDTRDKRDNNNSDNETDTYQSWWNESWGDGLDFSGLFNEDAEPADIMQNLNEQMSTKLSGIIQRALATSVDLANQRIDVSNASRDKERKATQSLNNTRDALLQGPLKFANDGKQRVLFNSTFEKIWERTKGNPKTAATLMLRIYRETHPREFRNNSRNSFRRPKTGTNGRKRRVNWEDLIDG